MKRLICLLLTSILLFAVASAQVNNDQKISALVTDNTNTATSYMPVSAARPNHLKDLATATKEISVGTSFTADLSKRSRKNKKGTSILPTGVQGIPFGSFTFKSDTTGHLATFENTDSTTGDGIKIKLGRTHPMWDGAAYLSLTNIISEEYDSLISKLNQYIDGADDFSADDLIDLMPHAVVAGSVINLTNNIIPHINAGLGLPKTFNIMDTLGIPNGLQLDILAAIGIPNGLIMDINDFLPPRNIGPYGTPSFTVLGQTVDPLPVVPSVNIIPNVAPRTLIADVGPANLIPDKPPFTMLPAIPLIPDTGLPVFSMPNFSLLNTPNTLSKENEFLTFTDKEDRVLGRVRAQSLSNWRNDFLDEMYMLDFLASVVKLDLLGGFVDGSVKIIRTADIYNKIGVEYSSGHGDYAEWLMRKNEQEFISAGDIVAVEGGKITKAGNNLFAGQYMVVSHKPIMLGNAPGPKEEALGNKVAFMGQVPVKVFGPVCIGDLIVPHPVMNGYGMAVHPEKIDLEQARMIVGRAWVDNPSPGFKLVNTLVGIHNGDFINILRKNNEKIESLESRLQKIESMLRINTDKKPF